jgi:hypothetical protein
MVGGPPESPGLRQYTCHPGCRRNRRPRVGGADGCVEATINSTVACGVVTARGAAAD